MSYKPDEKDWMAYLYGELGEDDRQRMDQYLGENAGARAELAKFQHLRGLLSAVEDKEVIAPPVFLDSGKQRFLRNAPFFRTIAGIAASLLVLLLAGKATDARISFTDKAVTLSFGEPLPDKPVDQSPLLSAGHVQRMIDSSLVHNNQRVHASLEESQKRLETSIRRNLADNSGKIDALVREAATASQDQIRQYVTTMQAQNMQMVKEYFQLTSAEQKTYIEDILVDFTQYMQQQRNDDLQMVETQISSLRQNTDIFKQETEQILTSIISSVTTNQPSSGTKN